MRTGSLLLILEVKVSDPDPVTGYPVRGFWRSSSFPLDGTLNKDQCRIPPRLFQFSVH